MADFTHPHVPGDFPAMLIGREGFKIVVNPTEDGFRFVSSGGDPLASTSVAVNEPAPPNDKIAATPGADIVGAAWVVAGLDAGKTYALLVSHVLGCESDHPLTESVDQWVEVDGDPMDTEARTHMVISANKQGSDTAGLSSTNFTGKTGFTLQLRVAVVGGVAADVIIHQGALTAWLWEV
ncbi:MAG: hypothetical protein DRR06_19395 [Gammaproteobacteria bacterium]|nr:MAG: hypothetical protein DRR06_19395 [Gammaproteobacteria bacterium]